MHKPQDKTNIGRIKLQLESLFSQISARPYNEEATSYFLEGVDGLYPNEDMTKNLQHFFESNSEELKRIVQQELSNPFFAQPEVLIVLERLQKKFLLKRYWETKYPIEDLTRIANAWGSALD